MQQDLILTLFLVFGYHQFSHGASAVHQVSSDDSVIGNILHNTGNACSELLQETGTRTKHFWDSDCRTPGCFKQRMLHNVKA